jgi:hypothetical protein
MIAVSYPSQVDLQTYRQGRYNARAESVPIGMAHRGSPTSLEYIWRCSMGDKSPKNKEKRKPKKAKAVAK